MNWYNYNIKTYYIMLVIILQVKCLHYLFIFNLYLLFNIFIYLIYFRTEIENIEVKLKNCRTELNQLIEINSKLEVDESNAKAIQSDITLIDSYTSEISRLEEKEHCLVTKLNTTGSNKTLEEALSEQSSIRSLLSATNENLEINQNALAKYNETLHELQQKKNKITSEELEIKTKVQAEKGLMDKLVDLQTLETALRIELNDARNSIGPVKDNLIAYSKSLEQTKKKHLLLIEEEAEKVMINLYCL